MTIQTVRIFNHLEGKASVDLVYDDSLPIGTDEDGEKIFEYTKLIFNNISSKQFKLEVIQEDVRKLDQVLSAEEVALDNDTKFETQNTIIKITI